MPSQASQVEPPTEEAKVETPKEEAVPATTKDCLIAFRSDRDGDYEIFIMDADGDNQRQLTFNNNNDYGAYWSPDGSAIAFMSDRDGD